MNVETFLDTLRKQPESIDFNDTMTIIDSNYDFSPTAFTNGNVDNESNQNNGSCKIFAFAQLQSLTEDQTLACFGNYYREDVINNPEGSDHGNIRNFMAHGWTGITFHNTALVPKKD